MFRQIRKLLLFLAVLLIVAASAGARGLHGGAATTALLVPANIVSNGDSITAGYSLDSPSTQAYPALLAVDYSTAFSNQGYSGQMACDNIALGVFSNLTGSISTPSLTSSTLYTLMFGVNEAANKGTGSYEAVFDLCQLASISWMATPITSKVKAQACSKTGTWTNDTTPVTGYGVRSTTNGSTLTCPITTTGRPIYIWYECYDGDGGTFTYAVDGGSAVSVNNFTSPAIATQLGSTSGMGLVRITGISAGIHSVVITVTSATNASNPVPIWAIGSPPNTAYSSQLAGIVGGVIRQYNNDSAAATSQYNDNVIADVALLVGDGLPIFFADTRSYVNTSTDMNDQFHPNVAGQIRLKQAFEAAYH